MRQLVHLFKESPFRFNDPEVSDDRFNEYGCNIAAPFIKRFFIAVNIIKWNGNDFICNAFRNLAESGVPRVDGPDPPLPIQDPNARDSSLRI